MVQQINAAIIVEKNKKSIFVKLTLYVKHKMSVRESQRLKVLTTSIFTKTDVVLPYSSFSPKHDDRVKKQNSLRHGAPER